MKTFAIMVYEEQGGTLQVKAKTKKQAQKIAEDYMDNYGFGAIDKSQKNIISMDVKHREAHIIY